MSDSSNVRVRRLRFVAGIVCGIALVFVARFVINETAIADWLVGPLLLGDTTGQADVIVVPGAGVTGPCVLNLHAVRRVVHAAQLWRSQRAPVILFTGGTGDSSCAVSVAMARFAREMGVSGTSIRVETASLNTRENGERSAPLLRAMGARRLLVVTDQLHMWRAAGIFERLGFDVERAAVPVYEGHTDNVSMLYAGLREFVAVLYYGRRGWIEGRPASPRMNDIAEKDQMTPRTIKNPEGPVVLLGASYAQGWDLGRVAGAPVLNRGVAGQQSDAMLQRFESDVVAAHPRAVIIWGFINNISRATPTGMDAALEQVRQDFTRMIELALMNGIEPILTTELTVRPPGSWSEMAADWVGWAMRKESYQDRVNREVMTVNRWLLELAGKRGLLVLDLQAVLAPRAGRRYQKYAQADGGHVTPAGYEALTEYARPILESHVPR